MRKVKTIAQKTTDNKRFYRNIFICLFLIFGMALRLSGMPPTVWAEDVKIGDSITIVTPGTEARLCPQPGCGPDQHITRIPAGIVLTIRDTDVFTIGTFNVKWFEVDYENQRGWVSIYDTNRAKKNK